jgi:hypothetical protein
MNAINLQQLEGSWKALALQTAPQKSLFTEDSTDVEVETAKDRVVEIFNQDRVFHGGIYGLAAEYSTPRLVADFMAGLANRIKPQSLLDPTCGFGLLLATVAYAAEAQILKGIEINHDTAETANQIWGGAIDLVKAEALAYLEKNDAKYDMIVCDPPINLRISSHCLEAPQEKPLINDFTSTLILSSLKALSPGGTAVFSVAPSFLIGRNREKFLMFLNETGFRISACVQAPSGTRHNTSIATYLLVLDHGEQDDIFIGQLKDEATHLDHLLGNLHRRKPKGDPSLGRICSLSSFQGFEGFAAREQLERLAREWRWTPHRGNDIIKEFVVLRSVRNSRMSSLQIDASSLFIKLIGKPQASRQSERFPKASEVAHIKVNTDLVDPAFLEYWLNESRIGSLTLASVQAGTALPRTRIESLLDATIYLPSKEQQRSVCDSWSYLQRVRSEADELESSLSGWAEPPEQILSRIRSINQEDRYEDWLESLPFPLASILWRHHAAKDSYRERYQMLLHFFEATAAFVATIHLSAYMSNEGEWNRIGEDLGSKLFKQGLSLERATFGAWKLVAERLASASSGVLKKGDEDKDAMNILEQIYGTSERQVLEMLSHKKLLQVLQSANKLRNDNIGHAGAVGEEAAKQIHQELLDLVYQLRSTFGRRWNRYELLQPGSIRYKAGVYFITCKRIMGTRSSPFEEREYESVIPLETDCLYLFDSVFRTGLKLQPFVEVIPSPERQAVACFIFNRVDRDSARWVSYHFDQESEISHPSSGVLSALSRLNRFNPSLGTS